MYARKKLDISWADLWFAGRHLFSSAEKPQKEIFTLWKGSDHTLVCLSVRTAFDLYLQALGLPKGSEVIMSALTIDDMVAIVERHGLVPVPLDIDPETLTADTKDLESLITDKTRAVIFAHLWGSIVPIENLITVAHNHNLVFIEDCAQAYQGRSYLGHPDADISLFSFGMIKTATALGGCIASVKDPTIQKAMEKLERQYATIGRSWYVQRLIKISTLKFLSYVPVYAIFVVVCRLMRKNYDQVIAHSTKGFPNNDILPQIRFRAPGALLHLLARRIQSDIGGLIELRTHVGNLLRDQLPDTMALMGKNAQRNSYWVVPLMTPQPERLVAYLQNRGFDATQVGTSMHVVPSAEDQHRPSNVIAAMKKLIYLPVYPELPMRQLRRLLQLLHEWNRHSGTATSVADMFRIYEAHGVDRREVSCTKDIQRAIEKAQKERCSISVAGMNRNLGGHSFLSHGIQLDMKTMNNVLSLDLERNEVTVESGITWHDLQAYLLKYQKTLVTMQSSSLFTAGGSIGSNIHGRDIRNSTMVGAVVSLTLVLADGSVVQASRTERSDLFFGVCGGYGLLGIIASCTLKITDNTVYERRSVELPMDMFLKTFRNDLFPDQSLVFFISEPSSAPGSFMKKTIITSWHNTGIRAPANATLGQERNVHRDRFFLGLARATSWGKELCWQIERILARIAHGSKIHRTNIMRPPTVGTEFINHTSRRYTEHVQEYFVPLSEYERFFSEARNILSHPDLNILDVSTRYLQHDPETLLSYAPQEPMLSLMVFQSKRFSYHDDLLVLRAAETLMKLALKHRGTYYLTDQSLSSFQYTHMAYPRLEEFLQLKKQYDPQGIFQTIFYKFLIGYRARQIQRETE